MPRILYKFNFIETISRWFNCLQGKVEIRNYIKRKRTENIHLKNKFIIFINLPQLCSCHLKSDKKLWISEVIYKKNQTIGSNLQQRSLHKSVSLVKNIEMKDLTNLSIAHLSSKNYWNKTINNSSISNLQMNPNHVHSHELKFHHRKSNPFAVIETLSPTRKSERKFDQLLFLKSARHSNTTHTHSFSIQPTIRNRFQKD